MMESAEGPIHITAVIVSLATHSLLNGTYSDLSKTYPKYLHNFCVARFRHDILFLQPH